MNISENNGINYLSDSAVRLILFAPNKTFVCVAGDFNHWVPALMNHSPNNDRFWIDIQNLMPEKEYAFEYLVEGRVAVADPYSEKILDRNHDHYITESTYPNLIRFPEKAKSNTVSVLQTGQKAYPWKTVDFKRPKPENLVIYELLVGDFTGRGNYQGVIDAMPYLKKLGINCLELMPIMEFTGNDSWGYNPTFFNAPDKAYGTANDLKRLIDLCHENNIAVVLDIVFNHADYEFPYVKMYWDGSKPSADSPFFNVEATHPYSVFFDFNHESPALHSYIESTLKFWLQEYKVDGFRFDLSKGYTQTKTEHDETFRQYDRSRVANIKRIYNQVRRSDATAYMILEHFADDAEEQTLTDMGMMVWGNHNKDFRRIIEGQNADFERISYKARGFNKPRLIGYMESHDEERLMFGGLNGIEKIKAMVALWLLVPGPKMIWQFGEFGYDVSINENGRTGRKPQRWEYLQNNNRASLMNVYRSLINIKLSEKIFQTTDFQINNLGNIKTLTLTDPSNRVYVVANLGNEDTAVKLHFPKMGKWHDFLAGTEINIGRADEPLHLGVGQFYIFSTKKMVLLNNHD